jgi:hypothetical protein
MTGTGFQATGGKPTANAMVDGSRVFDPLKIARFF